MNDFAGHLEGLSVDRLLSVADVAEVLGLSRFTIYSWASKRRLPAIKVGSRLMFRPSDLERWLAGRACKPATEVAVNHGEEGGTRG